MFQRFAHRELEVRLGACVELVEHPGRGEQAAVVERRAPRLDRIGVPLRTSGRIDDPGDLRDRIDDLASPVEHGDAGARPSQP